MGWPRILRAAGWLLLATMVVHVVALAVTGGPLTGPVSLRKPATFAETGWLLAWSVALLMPALGMRRWQEHVVGGATVLFGIGETAIMAVQAWRGVPSHYNFTTPLDVALMRGGAAGTAGVFLVGVLVLIGATLRARIPADVRLGVLAGALVLLAGSAIGFVMVVDNSGVYQGSIGVGFPDPTPAYLGPAPATVGPELLLIRPATDGGDLVLPHAIGVHGLILLAVPAVLLARTGARRRLLVTGAAAVAVAGTLAILLAHAFRGLPLAALSPLALGVLGTCVATLLAAYTAVGLALRAAARTGGGRRARQRQHHPLPR